MSHARGAVRFGDGAIRFFDYNGTADVCSRQLVETVDALRLRHMQDDAACRCGRDEPVEIATLYGAGFWWHGRACRHCAALTANTFPGRDAYDEQEGVPDWWPAAA